MYYTIKTNWRRMNKLTAVVYGSCLIMTPISTNGFLFNKRNRDITNAVITASFSPLFDKWINEMSEKPPSLIKEVVIEEPEDVNTPYNNPIYDIIAKPATTPASTTHLPFKSVSIPQAITHFNGASNKVYYIVETDPSATTSLKSSKNDGTFIITGEIVIAFLLIAILLELQKLTAIQRNINN